MPFPKILVVTESGPVVGYGHSVRSGHLAAVLDAATGVDVHQSEPWDLVVLDVMRPDLWLFGRETVDWRKLAVIVGAGWTISEEVGAAADLVVYQTAFPVDDYGLSRAGPDFLILDPRYAAKSPPGDAGAVVWFGAGIDADWMERVILSLLDTAVPVSFPARTPEWDPGWHGALYHHHRRCAVHVGSVGMTTYEAAAAGCVPITVARSLDHDATGHQLDRIGICDHFGLATEIDPEVFASVVAELLRTDEVKRKRDVGIRTIDGLGVFRVAEELWRLATKGD